MSASKSLVPLLIAVLLTAGISGCKTKEQEDPRSLPDLVRVATVREAQRGIAHSQALSPPAFRATSDFAFPAR